VSEDVPRPWLNALGHGGCKGFVLIVRSCSGVGQLHDRHEKHESGTSGDSRQPGGQIPAGVALALELEGDAAPELELAVAFQQGAKTTLLAVAQLTVYGQAVLEESVVAAEVVVVRAICLSWASCRRSRPVRSGCLAEEDRRSPRQVLRRGECVSVALTECCFEMLIGFIGWGHSQSCGGVRLWVGRRGGPGSGPTRAADDC
jgi:hypothetical protein